MQTTQAHPAAAAALGTHRLEHGLLLLPCLLLAAVTLPFVYRYTLSEPDLVRMMAALVYGHASGLNEAAGMHYGMKFSFAYYKLLYAVAPAHWLESPDLAAQLINAVGVVSGLACAAACTVYLRALFGLQAAIATALVFLLSPMMLPLALSGHPLVPAAACLFAGGWLLVRAETRQGAPAAALLAGGGLVLLLGLALRAEIVLAFPFLLLAARETPQRLQNALRLYAPRALVLAWAFGAFLYLQRDYVSDSGGATSALLEFMRTFMSPERTVRGMAVLGLAAGLATLAATLWAAVRTPSRARALWLPIVLGLPALLFWLPNPQPARHFFFPVLALALLVGLHFARSALLQGRAWLALPLAIAAGNQLLAELARPLIVSSYSWSYAPASERRATQQVPVGFFPLDQRANQVHTELLRREAMSLAAQAPERLLVLADSQHYLIAHLIAATPGMQGRELLWKGANAVELRAPGRSVLIIDKYPVWPRDLTADVLREPQWQDWLVYVQPLTVSRYDRTAVPAERRFAAN